MREKKFSGIYCFENIVNNKKYVGKSKSVKSRIRSHIRDLNNGKDHSTVLQFAWDKYGESKFIYYVIEKCPIEMLLDREIYWIKELKTHVNESGYNISLGGDLGFTGIKHKKETKEKISLANKGQKRSEETKQKMSENHADFRGENSPLYGKKHTEEQNKALSERMSGENNPNWGKPRTELAKENIAIGNSGIKKGNPTSNYIGVSKHKATNKWMAQLTYKGKKIYLGVYETEEEAARAYNAKALELYGPNARLNIIPEEKEV